MAKTINILILMVLMVVANTAMAAFPTSKRPATGQAWTIMGHHPFVGTVEEGCAMLGVSAQDCATFKAMREEGKCEVAEVPNGTVYDALLFAKDGKPMVQRNVRVQLEQAPSKWTKVCYVGNNAIISHDGCDNLALVRGADAPEVTVVGKPIGRPYQPTSLRGGCELGNSRYIALSVYAQATMTNQCVVPFIKSLDGRIPRPEGVTDDYDGNGLDETRLSRTCGPVLNGELMSGSVSLGTLNHNVEAVVHQGDMEYPVFQGSVIGRKINPSADYTGAVVNSALGQVIRIPDAYVDGVLEIRFGDYSKLASPTAYHIREYVSKIRPGCHPMLFSAVEYEGQKPMASTAP